MDTKSKKPMFALCTMILAVIMNSRIVKSSVELSPNVTLSSGICPQVTFNCIAVNLSQTTLRWFINDDLIASYPYDPSHQFPYNETLASSPWTDVVMIQIVNASFSEGNQDIANFYSTLTANLSALVMLGGNNINCGSHSTRSNTFILDFQYIAPPIRPLLECTLIISPRGVTVSIEWSSSFSSGNSVDNYHVVASPTPSSCPNNQLVSPSEDYNCSGLVLGTRYSFTVSSINCGTQEGTESSITVQPQVPLIPEIILFSTYNDENSLSQLTVTWQEKHLSISDVCSFDNSLNYSIFLNDSRGGRLEERVVNSDSCNNNLCSTSFNISSSSSNQSYLVSIYAINVFGRSNAAESTSIGNSLQSEILSLAALRFEDCVTTLLCSSVLAEGPCVVQYGRDSSYKNFDNHLNVSLNSSSPLPLMDASIQYYFQVEVRVNSTFYRSRRSFMTGEFAVPLTDTNIGLLIMGVIFLILDIIIFIFFIKCNIASTKCLWITLLLVAVFLWLVSACLWIAVGGVVGPQINTCDSKWQSNRDNLIIAAFVLSFISLLFISAITILVACYKKARLHESGHELEEQIDEEPISATFGQVKPSREAASKCQQCGWEFSIVKWNGPYYCDACGKSYCSLCSKNKAELPSYSKTSFLFGGQKRRVCDTCYKNCKKRNITVHGSGVRPSSQPAYSQPSSATSSQTTKNGSTTKLQTEVSHDHSNLPNNGTTRPDGKSDNQDGQSKQKIKFATKKPTWNPDTEVCEVCQKNPTRKFERHHCRACGKCVCSPCSQNKAYLPYEPKKAQRVCYLCYDICKNEGIKIVADTVTEESETEEAVDEKKQGV